LGWLKRTANRAVGIIAGNGVFAEWGCFGFVGFDFIEAFGFQAA